MGGVEGVRIVVLSVGWAWCLGWAIVRGWLVFVGRGLGWVLVRSPVWVRLGRGRSLFIGDDDVGQRCKGIPSSAGGGISCTPRLFATLWMCAIGRWGSCIARVGDAACSWGIDAPPGARLRRQSGCSLRLLHRWRIAVLGRSGRTRRC